MYGAHRCNSLRSSDIYMSHCHWFIFWLVVWSVSSHYLNQCSNIYWTPRDKFQWQFNRNTYFFFIKNVIENVVCKMAAILSRFQYDKQWYIIIKTTLVPWFLRGSAWTVYRPIVGFIFNPLFLEFIYSWGHISCFHIVIHLRYFTSNLLCHGVHLNCLSLDNHLVSKQPQWQCHMTMTSLWGHVAKQILNLAGWGQIRRDQNERLKP